MRPLDADADNENAELYARAAWLWRRLTYPTGKMPPNPWGRAAEHIRRFVPDAAPWKLEGAPLIPYEQMAPDSVIEPGLNTWVEFGPRPLDSTGTTNNAYQYGIVSGRLNVIVSDPHDRGAGAGDRAWIGFASGGLWRIDGIRGINCATTPCDISSVTATSMWDGLIQATQGVSAIEIDPTDATGNTVYAGTGDWQAGDQQSSGLIRTTDGGATWTQLGADIFVPYSNVLPPDQAHGGCAGCTGNRWSNQNIKAIKVDPRDAQTLLVGTRYDLYISHDAGATWAICPFGNNYTNAEGTIGAITGINRVSGIFLDTRQNPTRAYVAVGYPAQANSHDNGVYSFAIPSSGCPTWPGQFTTYFGGMPSGTGTATSLTGRIEIDGRVNTSDNLLTLYAQVQNSSSYDAQGTYVLRQGASSWTLLSGSGTTSYKTCANGSSDTGQDWYDLHLHIHPNDDKTLYLGHIDLFKTTVNSTYSQLGLSTSSNLSNVYAQTCPSYGKVHPDQHSFAFVEMTGDPNYGNWILVGNDGGLFFNDAAGAAANWVSLSRAGISTNQYYAGQIGMNFGDYEGNGSHGNPSDGRQWLFGGMQDNGNATWDSTAATLQWTARSVGGDGFWTAFDSLGGTLSGGYWLTEYTNGSMDCSSTGADGPFSGCGPNYGTESPDWSTPFMMDQFHCTNTQCKNILVGGDTVRGSVAYGTPSWSLTSATVMPGSASAGSIVSIAMARNLPGGVSVGTDNGKWWWTDNAFTGANCTQALANTSSFACTVNTSTTWRQIDSGNTVLPNRLIGGVGVDPSDYRIVYAAVGGFDENTPTTPGHVFRAVWNGSSFSIQNKTGNLPNVPAQAVAVNPNNPNQVFLGTYFGFFYTDDITQASPTWVRYMDGLPNAPIFHFSLDRGPVSNPLASSTLSAFTYGRGVYAIKLPGTGQSFCANRPAAPVPVSASATVANTIEVDWSDSATAGVGAYRIYRATTSGGPYTQIGSVPDSSPGVGNSGSYAFSDTPVSGGTTYFYVVRAVQATCDSVDSSEASATATGDCLLAPGFAGVQSVGPLAGGQGCGLRVSWSAGASACGSGLTYAVYRSTTAGFTPGPSNLIASCVAGTSWDDSTAPVDTREYYVVRAEDGAAAGGGPCNGGNMESNTLQRSGMVSSTGTLSLYWNDFSSSAADWVPVTLGGTGDSWQGIQACPVGTGIYRFGGAGCTDDYGDSNFVGRQPGGNAGVTVPAGTTGTTLAFQHRWQFEFGTNRYYDGATLALALDGSASYTMIPSSALSGTGYTGNLYVGSQGCPPSNATGFGVFGNTSTGYATNTMQSTTANLDAVCNTITGGSGGCAGHNVKIAFAGVSDCGTAADGWFIDNVSLTAQGAACTAAPQPVQFLTSTGKDTQATLEWLDPAGGPFASTMVRSSLASYPADPTSGTLEVNQPGVTNQKESYTDAGLTNGTPVYYAAFANSGANVFSARRIVSGLPQSTAGNWKWNFATPATALAPPIQGRGLGVFVPSNDRAFYGLAVGATGGTWKTGYAPAAMNGPAQSSPIVILASESGLPHDAAFVGSQDGYVYCLNAATGLGCTGWPAGGRSAAGFGVVQAQPMFDPTTHLVLVGSRNASGTNGFYGLNVANGTTAWSFTNTVPQGGDGQAIGMINGPALILGSQVILASRTRTGGSGHSVWALNFTAGTVSLAWARDLGDIDGSPTQDWTANRVIVGTNAGAVYALNPASNGATVWSRSFGDGAIRTWIYYDPTPARLYFATNTKVWAIPASGATGSDWTVSGLISPTRPILHYGTTRAYLGACADAGCTNGRVIELDRANSWATPKTYDLTGVGGLGPVTIDRSQSPALLHAGSRSGRVVAVQVPLP